MACEISFIVDLQVHLDVPVTIICFPAVYNETLEILHFSQANAFYFQHRHLYEHDFVLPFKKKYIGNLKFHKQI